MLVEQSVPIQHLCSCILAKFDVRKILAFGAEVLAPLMKLKSRPAT
jgi:hypothetical protein